MERHHCNHNRQRRRNCQSIPPPHFTPYFTFRLSAVKLPPPFAEKGIPDFASPTVPELVKGIRRGIADHPDIENTKFPIQNDDGNAGIGLQNKPNLEG